MRWSWERESVVVRGGCSFFVIMYAILMSWKWNISIFALYLLFESCCHGGIAG